MTTDENDDLVVELDDETMRLLKARARANNRTVEDEAKVILALWVGLGNDDQVSGVGSTRSDHGD